MKYKVLASTLVIMEVEAEDYGDVQQKMNDVFDRMKPEASVEVKGFNIEEIAEEKENE